MAMKSVLHTICAAISVVIVALFVVMTAVMFSLVVTRYVFSWSPPWSEEVTRYAMVWLVMLGSAMLTLFDDHIALHLLSERLTGRARKIQKIFSLLVTIGVSAVVGWIGFGFSLSMTRILSSGSGWPMTVPTFSVPFGAILIGLFALLRLTIEMLPGDDRSPAWMPKQFRYMDSSFRTADEARPETM